MAEGPTDEELLRVAATAIAPYEISGITPGEYEPETECAVEAYGSELIAYARAALARWGRPTPQPVAERPSDWDLKVIMDSVGGPQFDSGPRWMLPFAREVLARWGANV